jgi:hypothetical protein
MTHGHALEVPADEVRQAIHFTADRISNRFGLNVERVRGVLERTKYLGPNEELSGTASHPCTQQDSGRQPGELHSYIFSPSLTGALEYLEPEKALTFFETEDLDLLGNRESAIRYLSQGTVPLCNLKELKYLTKLFLNFLNSNREHIIKTGIPRESLGEFPVLESLVSPLY